MFKRGFTLQELLITIGVIGIVAAICAPAVVNMVPDKTKTMYMKAYTTLSNLTNEILNDSTLYYTTYDASGNPSCEGMRCIARPFGSEYSKSDYYKGVLKYPTLVASKLNVIGDIDYQDQSEESGREGFTTIDGVYWNFEINTKSDSDVVGGKRYETELTINTDSSIDSPCMYSSSCKNPTQFKFIIDNNGGIKPADALGMAYLQNATDMHAAKTDRTLASEIVEKAGSDTDADKMLKALNELRKKESGTKETKE